MHTHTCVHKHTHTHTHTHTHMHMRTQTHLQHTCSFTQTGKYPGSSKNWAIDMQELESNVNENTKMLIINTPNNPFGKVSSR